VTDRVMSIESFDPAEFAEELGAAPTNFDVGTQLWFTNDRIRVWEIRLQPGERAPFHAHARNYFWTVVAAGTARHRTPDGVVTTSEYAVGDTKYTENSPESPALHDLENVGDTEIRFVTVELLDPAG
jgi:hypothetical protein